MQRDQDVESEEEEGPTLQDPAKNDCNAEEDEEAVAPPQLYRDACDDNAAAGSDLVHDGGRNGARSKYCSSNGAGDNTRRSWS